MLGTSSDPKIQKYNTSALSPVMGTIQGVTCTLTRAHKRDEAQVSLCGALLDTASLLGLPFPSPHHAPVVSWDRVLTPRFSGLFVSGLKVRFQGARLKTLTKIEMECPDNSRLTFG